MTRNCGGLPARINPHPTDIGTPLFELVSQRYERAAVLISNLSFDEWAETFGTDRLTGALFDRLNHHVHILEMNGQSFRLNHRRA